MGFFTTDHDEAKNKFTPVKPGKYEVVVSESKVDTAKTSGNPMIKVTYTIRSDVDQEFQKRKVFDNFVATEKTMFKFQQAAKAMGFGQGQDIPSIEWFANQLLYKAFKLTIRNKKDTYQGEERIRDEVSFIDAPSVPYSGSQNGGNADPFNVPTDADFIPPSDDDANAVDFDAIDNLDETPPWEQNN